MEKLLKKSQYTVVFLIVLFCLGLGACQFTQEEQKENMLTDPITPTDRNHLDESNDTSVAKLIFVGDNMLDGKVAGVMDEKGNDYPLSEFMPILERADLVIANLETAVGTSRQTLKNKKKYAFQSAPEKLSLFEPLRKKLLFSLANNHGLDAPIEETLTYLQSLGYNFVGIGRNQKEAFQPYIAEVNGIKVGVIGTTRVIPFSSWSAGANSPGMASAYMDEPLLQSIRDLHHQVDYVLVYIHWGEELVEHPNQVQLQLEEKMVAAGAHLIIGSHPHVLQGVQWSDEKQLTAYSLGNFVFSTSTSPIANDTMALEIHLSKEKIEYVQVWPGQIQFGLVHLLEDSEEKERIYQRLRTLSPAIHLNEDGQITILE